MYCHKCAVKGGIDSGAYAGVPFENMPCAKCLLEENSIGTMDFVENFQDKKAIEGLGIPEAPQAESIPISVLGDALKLFLGLSDDELAVVRARFANKTYAEIAAERRLSPQAIESKLRRLLGKVPLLSNLFVAKSKKSQARQKRKASSEKRKEVLQNQQTASA